MAHQFACPMNDVLARMDAVEKSLTDSRAAITSNHVRIGQLEKGVHRIHEFLQDTLQPGLSPYAIRDRINAANSIALHFMLFGFRHTGHKG